MVAWRRHGPAIGVAANDVFSRSPISALHTLVALEFGPSLHRNLAAVKLSLALVMAALALVAICLTGFTPREVIKLPESIGWEDKVPDGEGQEVDEHPDDIGPRVRGDNNENTGKTENETEKHQRDDLRWLVDDRRDNCKSDKSAAEAFKCRINVSCVSITYQHRR